MALKDIWTNKTDDVDDILADDINAIANEVISNSEKINNKADKSDTYTIAEVDDKLSAKPDRTTVYTKVETDEMLSTKADKTDIGQLQASQAWQLIGKTTTTENTQNIVVDLPAPISDWYNETLMLVEVPKSESLNGATNGDVAIIARKGTTRTCFIITVSSTSASYGALDPAWVNRWAVITQWSDKKPLCTTVNRSRASAQAYSLASISAATFSYKDTVDGATNFVFKANQDFVFPTGSKFEIYGRF